MASPSICALVGTNSKCANLAMNLAANFDEGGRGAADPVEHQSSRPDFAVGLTTWHCHQKHSPFDPYVAGFPP